MVRVILGLLLLAVGAWGQCTEYLVGKTGSGRTYTGAAGIQSAVNAIPASPTGCHKVIVDSGSYTQVSVSKTVTAGGADSIIIQCRDGEEWFRSGVWNITTGCRIEPVSTTVQTLSVAASTGNFRMTGFVLKSIGGGAYYVIQHSGSGFVYENNFLLRTQAGYGMSYSSAPTSGTLRNLIAWNQLASGHTTSTYAFFPSSNTTNVKGYNLAVVGWYYGYHNMEVFNSWSRKGAAAGSDFRTISNYSSGLACSDSSCGTLQKSIYGLGPIVNFMIGDSATGNFLIQDSSDLAGAGIDTRAASPSDIFGVAWGDSVSIGPNPAAPNLVPPTDPPAGAILYPGRWGLRSTISIPGFDSEKTNFQKKLEIERNAFFGIQHGYQDIRFCADSVTVICDSADWLDYWVEDTSAPKTNVYVEVPTIPTTGTQITMFWGNPTAEAGMDGRRTFPLFFGNFDTHPFQRETEFRSFNADDTISDSAAWREMAPTVDIGPDGKHYLVYSAIDTLCDCWAPTKATKLVWRVSEDSMRTWSQEYPIFSSSGPANIFNPGMTIVDSVMIVVFDIGTDATDEKAYLMRSNDLGQTWGDTVRVASSYTSAGVFAHDPPLMLSNGVLLVTVYQVPSGTPRAITCRSNDTGTTIASCVTSMQAYNQISEPNTIELKTDGVYAGRVLLHSRTGAGRTYGLQAISTDYGVTWGDTTISPLGPFHHRLFRAPDGSLLAVTAQNSGVGTILRSTDEAATWDSLQDFKHAGGFGGNIYSFPAAISDEIIGLPFATNFQSGSGGQSDLYTVWYNYVQGPIWNHRLSNKPTYTDSTVRWIDSMRSISFWERDGSTDPMIMSGKVKHQNARIGFGMSQTSSSLSVLTNDDEMNLNSIQNAHYLIKDGDAYFTGTPREDIVVYPNIIWTPDSARIDENGVIGLRKVPANGNGITDTLSWAHIWANNGYSEIYWMFAREFHEDDALISFTAFSDAEAVSDGFVDPRARRSSLRYRFIRR